MLPPPRAIPYSFPAAPSIVLEKASLAYAPSLGNQSSLQFTAGPHKQNGTTYVYIPMTKLVLKLVQNQCLFAPKNKIEIPPVSQPWCTEILHLILDSCEIPTELDRIRGKPTWHHSLLVEG